MLQSGDGCPGFLFGGWSGILGTFGLELKHKNRKAQTGMPAIRDGMRHARVRFQKEENQNGS